MKRLLSSFILASLIALPSGTYAQWVQTLGPGAGGIYSFAVTDTGLFAGTFGGGVYLSADDGTSWTPVNNGLTNLFVPSIGAKGTALFAGTGNQGIFCSTDNGMSWTAVNNELPRDNFSDFYRVTSFAFSDSTLFAGTYIGGVFRSTDVSAGWASASAGLTNLYVNALAADGGNLFAGTANGGVFRSTDNGTSWTPVNIGLTDTYVNALAISDSVLLAGTFGHGVFRSTDNGASWTTSSDALWGRYVFSFAVSGTGILAGADDGIYLSTDHGITWQRINTGFPANTYVWSLAFGKRAVVAGTETAGIWRRSLSEIVVTSVRPRIPEVPERMALGQNWPNPFNPATTINYTVGPEKDFGTLGGGDLGRSVQVQLVVCDILGRAVKTLVNEAQEPGHYQVPFDGVGLASGVYLYRLTGGGFTETRRMMLLK